MHDSGVQVRAEGRTRHVEEMVAHAALRGRVARTPEHHLRSGLMLQGSGFRVQGSGFGVQGSGFRVQG